MSRRHKEHDLENNYKPQMESHDDGHPRDTLDNISIKNKVFGGLGITRRFSLSSKFSLEKIVESITKAFSSPSKFFEIDVDDEYVNLKIPLSSFDDYEKDLFRHFRKNIQPPPEEEQKASKRGAHPIKQLFNKIADSKVMEYFSDTITKVKKKCMQLYENITQFSICFLHGSHKAFAPDDDPYRKISHFQEMVKEKIRDFPTRRTLSNYNCWFVNWKAATVTESPKERKERHRHKIWEKLIEWIYHHLLEIAPEYAVQPLAG